MLNSLKSRKTSDHNAVKFTYGLNFRHSRLISNLFTIHSQGLFHFTPHGIHFNHDSRNSLLSNHDSQSTKSSVVILPQCGHLESSHHRERNADILLLFLLYIFFNFPQEFEYSVLHCFNNSFRNTKHGGRINYLGYA